MPDMDVMNCQALAVPVAVMQHVVDVESSGNPYAIGVVGGRLVRQPANLPEALATTRMLQRHGYNFSLGLAQVNRYNLARYGLDSYEKAFQACPNLQAGARILADCRARSGKDWGKAFSCYYSGDFLTGFRHGYVQRVFASMRAGQKPGAQSAAAIDVTSTVNRPSRAGQSVPIRGNAVAPTSPADSLPAEGHAVRVTAYGAPTVQQSRTNGDGSVVQIQPDAAFVF